MQHDPENKDAILKEAEYYFLTLKGDGYMHDIFSKWAEDNNVDISWFNGKIK